MKIGYARVSTQEQSLDRQIDALKANGAERIYQEKITGTKASRPQLDRMLETLRAGDTLIVCDFSRLSRSTKDLISLVERLNEMGVELISIKEKLDTTTATGKMMLTMISALVQFERDILAERTMEGLKASRARGRMGGRPKAGNETTKKKAIALYNANTMTNKEIAELSGVSTATLSRWIRESKEK
jgi:DNA invertase Pin-like site-specific DNA recombinase